MENAQRIAPHDHLPSVRWVLLVAILAVLWPARAQDIAAAVQADFDRSPVLRGHFHGFCLYDLDSNRFVAGVNERRYFTPASNAKVFTLFAALKNLGDSVPGIHYVVRGDSLIFWGTGDPTFLHPKLDSRKVYGFLKNSGRKLYYATETDTEEPFYRNGWAIEDYDEHYQPELSAFPIYGNVVTFSAGADGVISVSPPYFRPHILAGEEPVDIPPSPKGGDRFRVRRKIDRNTFVVGGGKIPDGRSIAKPFRYNAELFLDLLRDTLGRPVERIGMARPDTFATVHSVDTRELLREMMLESDNFLAEQLHMLASLARYGRFRTAGLREEMDAEHYAHFSDKTRLSDASGLSVYNKVTPRSMVELLLLLRREIPDTAALRCFFPAGGLEGTLKTAYPLDNGRPFVWAKTGTISSVHCQSGFFRTRSGRHFAFSFLNNNFLGSAAAVRREVARMVTKLKNEN